MKNIISIDPSLTSTAIVVKNSNYHYFSFFKDYKADNKWCKSLASFVQFTKIDFLPEVNNFSENELIKFKQYKSMANIIESALLPYLKNAEIRIESYSQGSKNGKFQDLITYGTLLRDCLLSHSIIESVPPKQLKKQAAALVYEKDNKGMIRNKNGKAAGSFNKWDMFYCLIDLNNNDELTTYCKKNYKLITANKNVPKPLEDLIDAMFLNLI